mgnify:CR=1 FL=1
MDKTTKTFVIAACSVVIATPLDWLGMEYLKARRIDELQRVAREEEVEKARIANRTSACYDRVRVIYPLSVDTTMEEIKEKTNWLTSCIDSAEPVEKFTFGE